jgi:hypothetical protein
MVIALHPQEVEVFYILPAIRRELSMALKELGKSQKEIAKLLGVTDAAVSQYLSAKRGDTAFPEKMRERIKSAAKRITDQKSMIGEIQYIITLARDERYTCTLHEQVTHDIPKGCAVCYER